MCKAEILNSMVENITKFLAAVMGAFGFSSDEDYESRTVKIGLLHNECLWFGFRSQV